MFSRISASFSIAFAAALVVSCGTARAGSTQPSQTWLVASDIHLDPYARGSDPALVGSDTNEKLLRATIAQMKAAVPNPAVVMLPGDFLAHEFASLARKQGSASPDDAGIATMRGIAAEFDRAFPHAQFAIALGNNDAPCGDYRSAFGSAYQEAVTRIWEPLVNRNGAAPNFARSFARDGSYTAALPLPALRLVAIDDVPLSNIYFGNCGDTDVAAQNRLSDLSAALSSAPAGTRTVVMMHLPPGYDPLVTQSSHGFFPFIFLKSGDNDALLAALSAPQNRAAFVVSGHAHRFDLRLAGSVPVIIFGSISPVEHNNPVFYALHVARDGSIRDIDLYGYDEWSQEWQPPRSFDAKWGVGGVDAASIADVHARLERDPAMRATWGAQSNGYPSNRAIARGAWGSGWRVAWCAQTELAAGFARCAGIETRARLLPLLVAAGILGLLAVVAALVVLARRLTRVLS
jgi:predicted phosphodiesterase